MRRTACLLLTCNAAAAELTSSVIRFVDHAGAVRYGAYAGGGRARALADEASPLSAAGPWAVRDDGATVEIARLLAPIPRPPAIYAIGLNYWGHINATNSTPPKTPSLFFKNINAFNDPFADVVVPAASTEPDYEGELGVVLGPGDCKDVSAGDAIEACVLGFTICHDVSARCFQIEGDGADASGESCPGNGGQFSFSKGFDTHAPVGPALVAPGPGDGAGLRLTTAVNGETRQNVSTSELVFGVREIVSFLSIGTTLPAGSVVCTGTPDGVGDTMDPQTYLQDGDVVEITIPEVGTLANPIVRAGSNRARREFGELDAYLPVATLR